LKVETFQSIRFFLDAEDYFVPCGIVFQKEAVRGATNRDRVDRSHEISMNEVARMSSTYPNRIGGKRSTELFSFIATLAKDIVRMKIINDL
jgi:hypothetical protein